MQGSGAGISLAAERPQVPHPSLLLSTMYWSTIVALCKVFARTKSTVATEYLGRYLRHASATLWRVKRGWRKAGSFRLVDRAAYCPDL